MIVNTAAEVIRETTENRIDDAMIDLIKNGLIQTGKCDCGELYFDADKYNSCEVCRSKKAMEDICDR